MTTMNLGQPLPGATIDRTAKYAEELFELAREEFYVSGVRFEFNGTLVEIDTAQNAEQAIAAYWRKRA